MKDSRIQVSQGRAAGVPVFVKQLGCNPFSGGRPFPVAEHKGGDPDGWPADLRVRQFPAPPAAVTSGGPAR